MVLNTILKTKIKFKDHFLKVMKNSKETKCGEVELTKNEQHGRIPILLSGFASILLANITAAIIVFSFELN